MPEFNEAFEQAVKFVIDGYLKPNVIAKVTKVDKVKNTCDVLVTGSDDIILDVNLLAIEANPAAKFVVYPKLQSLVTVSYLFNNSDTAQVIKYSETESMYLNGVQFGGLVKAEVLKTELEKTNTLIQALVSTINAAPIPEPGNGSPSALQVALQGALVGKSLGDYTNIKNDKVKHG